MSYVQNNYIDLSIVDSSILRLRIHTWEDLLT